MPNIPGATGVLPGVYDIINTASRGVNVPGGIRVAAMIGEGSTDQTLVAEASGGGLDGLDPTYSSATGADGRHFQFLSAPLIANRTTVFKNGIPLIGTESLIDSNPFSNNFDYRLDIATGRIELQTAHLQDQGGAFYVPLSTNVGDGYISNLTLVDVNAPPEIWTIRCVSVQRDVSNNPVARTAKFIAFGSVSGPQLDANGNPVIWAANDQVVSNGILSFAVAEVSVLNTPISIFTEGDGFIIKVASGVLVRSDSLTANYIPVANINNPILTQGLKDVVDLYGTPSTSNTLSLGGQLAYENQASVLYTSQAAPAMPRRTSYELDLVFNSLSTNDDDFIFPLPLGVTPDFNSSIHFFVTNNVTKVEKQILPNKFPFYTLGLFGKPTVHQFITDNIAAPAGNSFSYSVTQSIETIVSGFDGYIGRNLPFSNHGVFNSSVDFDSSYVGKQLKVIDALNVANVNTYNISSVTGGVLYVTTVNPTFTDFTNVSGAAFQVIDPTTGLPVIGGSGVDGTLVALIGTGRATLSSAINFGTITGIHNYKLQINGTTADNGLYDITNVAGTVLTIDKAIVNESNVRYEVIDPLLVSNYIVVNKNTVPNGNALRITLIDSRDATFYDAGWVNALASLEVIECDVLVVLPQQTISVIFQNALAHCKSMSNVRNRKERILFMGAINGLTPDNLTGVKSAAVENIGVLEGIQGATITDVLAGNIEDLANYSVSDAFGNTYRCVYFYPDQIVVQAGTDNILIDGFYIAAAAAGFVSADVHIENPLTNKVFSGFSILSNKMFSTFTLEALAAAGVTTLQPVAGGGRVMWGITTSQSGFPEEQEISIVFIRDRIAKTMRAGFKGFIGQPQTNDTLAILNTRAVILLNSLVSQGLITAYKDLTVVQDSVDPTQVDISVRISPTYPLNFVYIKISVGQL
jgi:hypothetical protein